MRKNFALCGMVGGAIFIISGVCGQDAAGPTVTPDQTVAVETGPSVTPEPTVVAEPSVTPSSVPEPTAIPQTSPVIPVPTPIGPQPAITPPPEIPPPITPPPSTSGAPELSAVQTSSTFQWSEKGAPSFELNQAVLTALQQNPDILRAKEEIERTRGIILEIGAQALPHVSPRGDLTWTDPNLDGSSFSGGSGGGTGGSVSGGTGTSLAIRLHGPAL